MPGMPGRAVDDMDSFHGLTENRHSTRGTLYHTARRILRSEKLLANIRAMTAFLLSGGMQNGAMFLGQASQNTIGARASNSIEDYMHCREQ